MAKKKKAPLPPRIQKMSNAQIKIATPAKPSKGKKGAY